MKQKLIHYWFRIKAILGEIRHGSTIKLNEEYYKYVCKKFRKYLSQLPTYKHTHRYSKKVWWCWLQGEDNAPELCKRCLESLRTELKDREIVIITNENYNQYAKLPEYIISKYEKGFITHTHFSDLLRIQILAENGGTWIDSSVYCTKYDKHLFDRDLFAYSNYWRNDDSMKLSSWFITSEVGNPIINTTRDLLFEYWRKNNSLVHYFLLHFCFTLACEKYADDWDKVPTYSNIPPHILQFELAKKYSKERAQEIRDGSSMHKLNQHFDQNSFAKDSNYMSIINGEWGK